MKFEDLSAIGDVKCIALLCKRVKPSHIHVNAHKPAHFCRFDLHIDSYQEQLIHKSLRTIAIGTEIFMRHHDSSCIYLRISVIDCQGSRN